MEETPKLGRALHSHEELEERFFSEPPGPVVVLLETWEPEPMDRANRRAMKATVGMLGLSAVAFFGLTGFSDAFFVSPVKLGAAALEPAALAAAATVDLSLGLARLSAQPVVVQPVLKATSAAPSIAAAVRATPPRADAPIAEQSRRSQITRPARAPAPRTAAARAFGGSATDQLTNGAYRALRSGRATEAESLARQAIRLDPSHASAYIALGGAHDALGEGAAAQAAFRSCVSQAKDSLVSACRTLARHD